MLPSGLFCTEIFSLAFFKVGWKAEVGKRGDFAPSLRLRAYRLHSESHIDSFSYALIHSFIQLYIAIFFPSFHLYCKVEGHPILVDNIGLTYNGLRRRVYV